MSEINPSLLRKVKIRDRVIAATKVAFPDTLSLEDAAKHAFSGWQPTPQEVMEWCDEYHRLQRKRYEDAKAFAQSYAERLEAEEAA